MKLFNKTISAGIFHHLSIAWLVLVISLIATGWGWLIVKHTSQQQIRSTVFDYRVERIKNAILNRMFLYQQVLEGGAGLFTAAASVERYEWHDYVQNLHLEKNYPGIQGVGFSKRILPQDLANHQAEIRVEGGFFANYTLRPAGERQEYTSIIYLEPLDKRNQQAIGYDMFAEPTRHLAMTRARDTGEPALSGNVTLVQEIDKDVQAGCLLYIPVYRNGQPIDTVEEKRAALVGYVYSPFRMNNLMRGIFGEHHDLQIDFHIYDADNINNLTPDKLMYDEARTYHTKNDPFNYSPQFTRIDTLDIAGHSWTIQFATLPEFEVATQTYTAHIVLVGGLLVSFLLFGITRSLETAQSLRTERQANARLQIEIRERHQVEQALHQSEERLSQVLEHSPLALLVSEGDEQHLIYINQRFLKQIGYTREDMSSVADWWPLAYPDEHYRHAIIDRWQHRFTEAEATGKPIQPVEAYIHCKDGQVRVFDVHLTRVNRLNFVAFVDLTERKQVEQALQQSEERFNLAMRGSSDGLWDWNLATNEVYLSPRWKAMLGYADHEIPHHFDEWRKRVHPQDLEKTMLQVTAYLEKRVSFFNPQFRMQHKDGHYVWILGRAIAVWNTAGKPVRMVGTHTDLTALKHTEEALRQSEERFDLAMRGSNDGLWDWNMVTNEVYFSPRWKEMLGYADHEIPHHLTEWSKRVHPADLEKTMSEVTAYLETQRPSYENIQRVQHKDGHYVWVLDRGIAVWNTEGKPVRMVGTHTDLTTLKQTEEALTKSEAALRRNRDELLCYFEQPLVGMLSSNLKKKSLHMNQRFCDMVGYSQKEMQILDWGKITHPEDLATDQAYFDQVLRGEMDSYEMEKRYIHKDGHFVYVHLAVNGVRDEHGQLEYFIAMMLDISRRKRAEQALEANRILLHSIINSTPDVIYMKDLQGRYLLFNAASEKAVGKSMAEVLGQDDYFLFPPNEAKTIMACDRQVLEGQSAVTYEEVATFANGEVKTLLATKGPVFSPEGEKTGIFGIVRDFTERKQMELALQQSEAKYRRMVETSQEGIWTIDAAAKTTYVNARMANLLGYSEADLLGKSLFDFMDDLARPEAMQVFERRLHGLGEIHDFRFRRQDGSDLWAIVSTTVMTDAAGRFLESLAMITDITQRKQIELDLQHTKDAADVANRAKSTFLANMSHELRTPLNGILGYAQILHRDNTLTAEQREGIQVIEKSGEYLLTLINDILDLAKVEAGKIELSPTVVVLEEFLRRLVQLFELRAEQKGLQFSYHPLSDLPVAINVDEKRLQQILINLLSNAFKFTESGEVNLKVVYQPGELYFQVEDQGCGIAAADLDKIFQPFQQVGDKKYWGQGTGLGLPITKKLVEMMGGELRVTSTVGQGSIFMILLKLSQVPNILLPTGDAKSTKIIGYQGRPRTILVIDDNTVSRSILVHLLTSLGFITLEAAGGHAGLHQAQEIPAIDLILVDLVMPDLDGFAVIQQLRQLPKCRDTVLIAVSASVFEMDRQKSLELGCQAFVAKPIKFDVFLEQLRVHLNLTWLYDQTIAVSTSPEETNIVLSKEIPPAKLTSTQMTDLLYFTRSGDVQAVLEYTEKLANTDKTLATFARYLHQLAEQFEFEKIAEILER